jgi:hypothetical protein
MDVNVFFPAYGNEEQTEEIRSVCVPCVVRMRCLREAMAIEGIARGAPRYGVWGGTTAADRKRLAAELRKRRALARQDAGHDPA